MGKVAVANATYRDCRAGFDVFRRHGGNIDREDLNAELVETGYGVVADRTFNHYRKLLRSGFDRYISINRFDISRAAIPFEDASANPRYHFDQTDQGVRLLIAKGSDLYVAGGRARQVGEVGAIVRIAEPEFIAGLERLRVAPGNMVSLRFLESGVTVEGRIVEVDLESSPALLEVDFAEVTSLYELGARSPIPKVVSSITLRTDDEELIPLDLASRRLFNFFDLVEGLRSIVNRSVESRPARNYAEPPVLVRLRIASPAIIDLLSAPEVAGLLKIVGPALAGYALKVFPQARKTWYEGTGQQLENQLKRQKVEEARIANEEKRLATELGVAIAAHLGLPLPEGADNLSRAIDDHVLPSLARLAEQGVSDVEVTPHETKADASGTAVKSDSKRKKPRKAQRNR